MEVLPLQRRDVCRRSSSAESMEQSAVDAAMVVTVVERRVSFSECNQVIEVPTAVSDREARMPYGFSPLDAYGVERPLTRVPELDSSKSNAHNRDSFMAQYRRMKRSKTATISGSICVVCDQTAACTCAGTEEIGEDGENAGNNTLPARVMSKFLSLFNSLHTILPGTALVSNMISKLTQRGTPKLDNASAPATTTPNSDPQQQQQGLASEPPAGPNKFMVKTLLLSGAAASTVYWMVLNVFHPGSVTPTRVFSGLFGLFTKSPSTSSLTGAGRGGILYARALLASVFFGTSLASRK